MLVLAVPLPVALPSPAVVRQGPIGRSSVHQGGTMEPEAINQTEDHATDDREWELADEDLDRSDNRSSFCSTSRPCSTSRCHCR